MGDSTQREPVRNVGALNRTKELCIHHGDLDGLLSAAIVKQALGDIRFVEMDYGMHPDWNLLERADRIIIVDFSLLPEDMDRLLELGKIVVWIDHHGTAISKLSKPEIVALPGIRSVEKAACLLTWEFYFPSLLVPDVVAFVADRDTWKFSMEGTKAYCEGLQSISGPPNSVLWMELLSPKGFSLTTEILARGTILLQVKERAIENKIDRLAFPIVFHGHRTLAINALGSGELGHAMTSRGYDVAFCYVDVPMNGRIYRRVSLYSENTDVSAIAKTYGGGGHKGAAGFTLSDVVSPRRAMENIFEMI